MNCSATQNLPQATPLRQALKRKNKFIGRRGRLGLVRLGDVLEDFMAELQERRRYETAV